ncbi:MAG: hypothetical protein CL868_07525 [Cytophagaceae bacterium]|nr:hypothetical protein [Cytophagaceae bacterium]|tara:strand:+ start:2501 stop:3097 length:597 start_codon:yes stop_codon:yes gene_type:complete
MEIDWLIAGPIIAGIVGIFLGYLIGYASKKAPDYKNEIASWQNKYDAKCRELNASVDSRKALEGEVAGLQTRLSNVEADLASSQSKLSAVQNIAGGVTTSNYDADHVKTAYGKTVNKDDLTLIDGIDTTIAGLLKNYGITTWYELSRTPVDRCRQILAESNKDYERHMPSTWPDQARLAYEGKWTELKEWQASHAHHV